MKGSGLTFLAALMLSSTMACSTRAMTDGACEGDACSAADANNAQDTSAVDAAEVAEPVDVAMVDAAIVDVSMPVDVVEACVPACGSRMCGDNGCGGSCGTCGSGSVCGATGSCDPDPATQWVVEVVDGMVLERMTDGSNWDPFGGLPDPLVCVTIGTDRQCSSSIDDTISPVWNFRHPMTASAATLQSGVRFEVSDYDPTSSNDVVGDVTAMATPSTFTDPVWTVTVGRSTVRVRLTVAP